MAASLPASWQDVAAWSLGVGLKGILLLLAVLLLVRVVSRRASAGERHLLWSGGIVAVLLLPAVAASLPWRLPVIPIWTWSISRVAAPEAGAPSDRGATADSPTHGGEVPARSSGAGRGAIRASAVAPWLVGIWAAGTACGLVLLGLGAVSLRRLVRDATPIETPDWTRPLVESADRLGLAHLPRLAASDRVAMPVLCGLLTPTIVVPTSAAEWSDGRRRAVLAHELAHVRRHDLPFALVSRVVCALYWFNPLVWLAAQRLRVEGERASDDLVLGHGTRPSEYADHLLQIVCGARQARAPAVAIPMGQPREFEGRMLAILDERARRGQPSIRQALGLVALVTMLMLPIAAAAPVLGTARRDDAAIAGGPMVAALVAALEAPEADDRARAARALGTIGARAAVPALGRRLAEDRDTVVRGVSALAIGQTGSPEGTRFLSEAARGDPSPNVQGVAIWALGQIADPAAVPVLEAALRSAYPGNRALAAWALGRVRPPVAPTALLDALADPDLTVSEWAAWATGQIRDPAAIPGLEALARAADPTEKAAYEAAWSLALIGGDAVRPALTEALRRVTFDPALTDAISAALAGRPVEPRPRPWPMSSPF